jgi:hypothetical protein
MKTIAQPEVAASLRARLVALGPGTSALWGKMNAHQMLMHVSKGMQRVTSGEAFPPMKRNPSKLIKLIALRAPIAWPKGLPSTHEPAEFEFDESAFEAERLNGLATLETMIAADGGSFTVNHPAFGRMSTKDWYRWAFLHLDHHLRQFGL